MKKGLKRKLRDRDEVVCAFLRIPDPAVAEIMALSGVEMFVIDMEHYVFDLQTVQNIVRAAELYGAECLIRVTDSEHGLIGRVLDLGASGILLADAVDSNQVRKLVEAVKYPPIGKRGASTDSRAGRYGYFNALPQQYPQIMNDKTVIGAIIETKSAIADLDQILAISELDFVSVGTMDLTFAFGVPGETNHPEIIEIKREIYRRVIASGKSALDKTPNQIALDEARQSGINCLYINSDTTLLKKGVDDLIGIIRA